MDDDVQHLEAELSRLQPVAPSRELTARIGQALERTDVAETRPTRRPGLAPVLWIWATVVPAAAAVAILLARAAPSRTSSTASAPVEPATAAEAALKPFAVENILVAAQDEGLVTLEDGTTARRARLRYVDTITWKNARTNASLIWTVPREEVRVVPVNFQ